MKKPLVPRFLLKLDILFVILYFIFSKAVSLLSKIPFIGEKISSVLSGAIFLKILKLLLFITLIFFIISLISRILKKKKEKDSDNNTTVVINNSGGSGSNSAPVREHQGPIKMNSF